MPREEYFAGLGARRFRDLGDSLIATEVELLDLSHNDLQTVADFPAMPKLRELRLVSNHLSSLAPRNLPVFEELVTLDVSFNRIADFSGLAALHNLRHLNLAGNRIERLSDFQIFAASKSTSLTSLDISGNSIAEIPQLIYLTPFLEMKKLILSCNGRSNPVCSQKGYRLAALQSLPDLEILDSYPVDASERSSARMRPSVMAEGAVKALGPPRLEVTISRFEIKQEPDRQVDTRFDLVEGKLDGLIENLQTREQELLMKLEEAGNLLTFERKYADQLKDENYLIKQKLTAAVADQASKDAKLKKDFTALESEISRKESTWKSKLLAAQNLNAKLEAEKIAEIENLSEKLKISKENSDLEISQVSAKFREKINALETDLMEARSAESKSVSVSKFFEIEEKLVLSERTCARLEISIIDAEQRELKLREQMEVAAVAAEEAKKKHFEIYRDSEKAISMLEAKIDEGQARIKNLTDEKSLLEIFKSTQGDLLSRANSQIEELKCKLDLEISSSQKAQIASRELEKECKRELNSMAQAKKAVDASLKQANEFLDERNKILDERNKQLEAAAAEISEKSKLCEKMKIQETSLKRDFISLAKKFEISEKTVLELKEKLKNTEFLRSTVEAENLAQKLEISKLRSDLEISNARAASVESADKENSGRLRDLEISLRLKDKVSEDLADQLKNLKTAHAALREEISEKQKKRDVEWKNLIEEETEKVKEWRLRFEDLSKKTLLKEDEIEALQQKLAAQEKAICYITEEMDELRQKWKETEKRASQTDDLQDEIDVKQSEIKALRDQVTRMDTEVKSKEVEAVKLRNDLEESKKRIHQCESEMRVLIQECEKQRTRAKEKMKQATTILQNIMN